MYDYIWQYIGVIKEGALIEAGSIIRKFTVEARTVNKISLATDPVDLHKVTLAIKK